MKSIFGYLCGAALGLGLMPAAHAESTYGIGTCTASSSMTGTAVNLAGDTQLKIGDTLIPQTAGSAVFNEAECECASRDIKMYFNLKTGTGTGVTAPVAEMYIGEAACDEYSMRSTRVCDQVTKTSVPNNDTWALNGMSFQTVGMFDVVIPPEAVTNPKPAAGVGYTCQTAGITNATITVTVGPPMAPAVCSMPVAVNTVGPVAPQNVTITTGDGGLGVSWNVPMGTGGIENYQVLCRKHSAPDQIPMAAEFLEKTQYYFSSCINKHLYRRRPGNLTIKNDAATAIAGIPIRTNDFPLDPRLRCSDRVPASGTTPSVRLSGLSNGETYDVMVVSIDPYGNASGSTVISATPQANVGPLTDYCDNQGCPGFGCQTGRGVPTPGGAGAAVAGLALGLLAVMRRARRTA